MTRLIIMLHDTHAALLEQQAAEHYRNAQQHAAWLVACTVSASAVEASTTLTLDLDPGAAPRA